MKLTPALLVLEKLEKSRRCLSRNRRLFRYTSSEWDRYIRQRRIPRSSLLSVSRSAWRKVYHSNDDQSMITLTGFDVRSFHYLLALFAPVFEEYSPFGDENGFIGKKKTKRGRPHQIQAIDCLGLLLSWTRTRGSLMSLQLVFGMTHTPLGKYLQFARRIILKVLKKHPLAEIKMPTMEKLEEYRQAIHRRHPALPNVWGTMDGLKCLIERPGNEITETRFYNGVRGTRRTAIHFHLSLSFV
mgnify:CR=1 FL=1